MRKIYSDEEKWQINQAGNKIRGFFKLNRINNSTQEYLPLKRAVQFKMVHPEKNLDDLIQDIVEGDVSPRCSTTERTKEILSDAVEEFLLDVELSQEHQEEYDAFSSEEEKIFYVICLIAEAAKNFRE